MASRPVAHCREKARAPDHGPGAWLHWLQQNFRGAKRTAQKYMQLARAVPDAALLDGLSLRQMYLHLGIATEPKRRAESPHVQPLPPYVRLAHKLLVVLESSPPPTQSAAIRQDLRPLYERLRRLFEPNLGRFAAFQSGRAMTPNRSSDDVLLRRLAEHNDESATAALFVHLYRLSPELRHWLHEDFARDATLRTRLDRLARADSLPAIGRFADLTHDNGSWREEQRRLKAETSGRFYGGLTWNEVVDLVHHYQAGTLDLGAFLLVAGSRPLVTIAVLGWLALLESVLPSGRRRLLKHLHAALAFVRKYENPKKRRGALSYADWWKLHALFYILRHPRPCYRTRELRAHLATHGLDVGTKDIRRFCLRHGIRRDMRAGRPRKRA